MYGRTNAHDVLCKASGAMIAATTASTPVAIQIGKKRAATTAFEAKGARRVAFEGTATPSVGVRALTDRPIRGCPTVKS
jgi:hypothetical protein